MKTMKIKTLISMMVISMLFISSISFAQQGNGQGNRQGNRQGNKSANVNAQNNRAQYSQANFYNRIPDLTDTQKEQIKTIRTKMMKEMLPLRNSLKEKMAHLNTLSTAETVDMKAVNKQIEEIGKIKTEMMKVGAKYRQEIRSLLTDDQRIFFDMHSPKMNKQGNRNHNNRRGNCRY